MTLALEALNLVNLEFVCDGAHHAKKDRHEFGDDCPVTARYQLAIKALEEALAKQEQGEPVVCCQEYDTCLKPCTPRGKHLAQQEQSVSVGEPDDLMIAYMSGLYDGKKQAKQEQGEPDELKHIDERDYLLDVDEKAWRSLIENRGGCRCHLSPPCGACTDPISEEEMNEVGYTYTTPQPAQKPLTRKQIDELAEDCCFLGNIYEIVAAIEAAHGIKENT